MNTRQILLYCVMSLVVTLIGLTVMFRYAAISPQALAHAQTAQPMGSFSDINLGSTYGTVSMTDLVGYYLQHPPKAPAAGSASAAPVRIGGC